MTEETVIEEALPAPEESDLSSVLIAHEHDDFSDAALADIVDAAPVAGDVLFLVRKRRAERDGEDFPNRQAYIQNIISDLPAPLAYPLESLSAPNMIEFIEDKGEPEIIDGVKATIVEGPRGEVKLVVPTLEE
jgi:hypothetical protein